MAWNQPGDGKNPWGRRPGASDLDTRVKAWQKKLEAFFTGGGKGEGGESGPASAGSGMLPFWAALALIILWGLSGTFQVKSAEKGVIQRFGKLVDVRNEGLGWHFPWPIERLTKVNVQNVNSSDYKSRVLTADVNLVDLRFAVQYRYSDPIKALFRVSDPEATLREVSESAIREIVGQSDLEDVLVGATRPKVTQRSQELIQRTLDFYNAGITITSVNLTDVQVPEAVIPSQRDANKALADQERFIKEAQAYANGILPVAQGAAARLQQDAEAYKSKTIAIATGEASRFTQIADAYSAAPEVTRKRLYIENVEAVLSRSRKVLVDSKPGGNIIYLPLDKLADRAPAVSSDHQPDAIARPTPEPDTVTVDGRSREER